ncbi:hypothetical protein BOSE62_150139 [Bosea sp. 62]|nr:hypothetical protein BOSE21B_10930 [Bosea sp. 21B]CAD5262312.1 hypothetical protein BOSE7B_150207 [Bosea sp. 7B]CAD5272341.1 hypothetical protein BOSE46_20160 [Bosea sp. 46]VVT43663.1 hypothetical protein BOS5A_10142 [Bosea sp. EC-HK365B]VXB21981.1 hypothetical protein BOSE29B_10696 [Bosea sp. 29B]VXB70202.1 hypothetical protein BOSE62_150139 [Bosea sp. 62]VXC34451.1 hypothetical protein BOSE127_180209 [Bosea sp. 127]VXC56618.1 hypothetical protein BOSE125_30159 [Bosea sp. 125]
MGYPRPISRTTMLRRESPRTFAGLGSLGVVLNGTKLRTEAGEPLRHLVQPHLVDGVLLPFRPECEKTVVGRGPELAEDLAQL